MDAIPLDNRARQGIRNGLWMGGVCWIVLLAIWEFV